MRQFINNRLNAADNLTPALPLKLPSTAVLLGGFTFSSRLLTNTRY
ncbi:MAG: hypothetical protein GX348_04735 [Veillonellaceae bacterium]|nr:hypothetical protein [Veillonellaceae bacterium]